MYTHNNIFSAQMVILYPNSPLYNILAPNDYILHMMFEWYISIHIINVFIQVSHVLAHPLYLYSFITEQMSIYDKRLDILFIVVPSKSVLVLLQYIHQGRQNHLSKLPKLYIYGFGQVNFYILVICGQVKIQRLLLDFWQRF